MGLRPDFGRLRAVLPQDGPQKMCRWADVLWTGRRELGLILVGLGCIQGMRFTLTHPTDTSRRAEYGFDGTLATFFVDAFYGEEVVASYSAFEPAYNVRYPLWGALVFLAANGFLAMADIEDAISATDTLPEHMPKRLRRAAEVVASFKEAAD